MTNVRDNYKFKAKVWLYPGMSGWHFVSLRKKDSAFIKERHGYPRRGWGSIPVKITLGKTTWSSSIFPDKRGCYVLPLKSEIRKKEKILDGDEIILSLEIGR